jgi:hypothetical protein
VTISGTEWVQRFAAALGCPAPTEEEVEAILALAGIAAHASERTAAPISAWVAGRAGVALPEARAIAERLAQAAAAATDEETGAAEQSGRGHDAQR